METNTQHSQSNSVIRDGQTRRAAKPLKPLNRVICSNEARRGGPGRREGMEARRNGAAELVLRLSKRQTLNHRIDILEKISESHVKVTVVE